MEDTRQLKKHSSRSQFKSNLEIITKPPDTQFKILFIYKHKRESSTSEIQY